MENKKVRSHGLYFEELEPGMTMSSPGRTVTETDIVNFCGLSGDFNQLHSNEEFARQDRFGKRIGHGLLGLAMATGLASRLGFMEGTTQALLGMEWKFKAPLYIGDTIHVEATIRQRREVKRLGGGVVVFDIQIVNQDGIAVQEGQWTLLMKGLPQGQVPT